MNTFVIVLVALVICALVVVKKSLVIIPQSETKIIERLGKYYATLRPGINIIIPFIDRAKEIVAVRRGRYIYTDSIDLREQVYDFDKQNVITKDGEAEIMAVDILNADGSTFRHADDWTTLQDEAFLVPAGTTYTVKAYSNGKEEAQGFDAEPVYAGEKG